MRIIHTDLCDKAMSRWSEARAWDDFVRYYQPAMRSLSRRVSIYAPPAHRRTKSAVGQ